MIAPDQRADEAAVAVLQGQALVVEVNVQECLDDVDPVHLHDLRVAGRRSRSVLGQLSRVFPRKQRRVQARNLRWIQSKTGPTRDLDVQLMEWDALVSGLPAGDRQALEPVHDLLLARRADAFATMHRALGSSKFGDRWSAWRTFLASDFGAVSQKGRRDAGRTIEEVAGRRIRSLQRSMVRDGGEIDRSSPATALHELRKKGKELRYLLELFGEIWSLEQTRPTVETLKELQDALGDHQDREVQANTLRSLQDELRDGDGPGAGHDTFRALDLVIERFRQDQREARDRFADRFDAFAVVPIRLD